MGLSSPKEFIEDDPIESENAVGKIKEINVESNLLPQMSKQAFERRQQILKEINSKPASNKRKREESVDKKPAKKKKKALIFNNFNTSYSVVEIAAKNQGFKVVDKDHLLVPSGEYKLNYRLLYGQNQPIKPEDFDVVWFDLAIQPEVVSKLKPYQRISQWPGISVLTHKNRMAKNLALMKKQFPKDFNFFPETFVLPNDLP